MSPRDEFLAAAGAGGAAAAADDAPLLVGFVVTVSGANAAGVLAIEGASPEEIQAINAGVQIGAVLKIPTQRSIALGIVTGVTIQHPSSPPSASDARTVNIDLFGEMLLEHKAGSGVFQRGLSAYPSLGQPIYAASLGDLARIYAQPQASNLRIGSLHQDTRLPAYVMTDRLLAEHFAVLGTSGSGKSCTVALLLRAVLDAHPNGHVILLDPHNEYAAAFGDTAELVNTDNLRLPFWLFNFEESCAIMTSRDAASAEAERGILKNAILTAKLRAAGNAPTEHYTVDTPVPYRMSDLLHLIEESMGRLNKADNSAPYIRIISRLEGLRADRRFAFMFSSIMVRDMMGEVLSRLLRIPVDGRPIAIVDLSGVPSEVVDVVVSVLVRMVFDYAIWGNRDRPAATLLVCEEAHRYIPRDQAAGFGPTRRIIEQIAKEGRKYGVSLGLVTQRPSEISETILSQCNTLFALRMTNDRDQQFVQRALPESAMGFFAALSALHRQEAIVVGEGVSLPMRVRFDTLPEENRPRSRTTSFTRAWDGSNLGGAKDVEDTVERWRRQTR